MNSIQRIERSPKFLWFKNEKVTQICCVFFWTPWQKIEGNGCEISIFETYQWLLRLRSASVPNPGVQNRFLSYFPIKKCNKSREIMCRSSKKTLVIDVKSRDFMIRWPSICQIINTNHLMSWCHGHFKGKKQKCPGWMKIPKLHPGQHPGSGLVVDHVEMTSRGNGLRHRTVWSQSPGAGDPFRTGKSHRCPCEKGWKKPSKCAFWFILNSKDLKL